LLHRCAPGRLPLAAGAVSFYTARMDRLPLEVFYIYFSPYTAHALEIDDIVYPTTEHAYQCARYEDEQIREEIRMQPSPIKAWETSCRYKHLQKPAFKDEQHKLAIMKDLMRAKATQHADIRAALLGSGDAIIVKHIVTYPPGDGFWDDGPDGTGANHIGRMWMEIRDELRAEGSDE